MMKIKIIDLLNKIYNCDDMPKKIIFDNRVWFYECEFQDYQTDSGYLFGDYMCQINKIKEFLEAYVEIIEENDSFTGVKFFSNGNCFFGVDTSGELKLKDGVVVDSKIEKIDINRMLQTKKWKRDKNAWKKINELIDEVNKLKNGGK